MPRKCPMRNVCFTINNFTEEDCNRLSVCHGKMNYLVWGKEVGENGTPHIQGYCEFSEQVGFPTAKRLIGETAHLERRSPRSTPKQAAGYCKKGNCGPKCMCEHCKDFDGDYEFYFCRTVETPETWVLGIELGEISSQGKRSDISAPVEMLREGGTIRDVAMAYPEQHVKYHKGFRDLRSLMLPPRSLDTMPEVIVLWGLTGTGKTRDAYIKYWPDEPHYVWKPSNGNWWDGYDGEKKIIIDEFRGQMTWSDILGLLDRNEFRAPYKGGFVNIQADKFVITSPFPPDRWYKEDDRYDRFKQLERRITKVIEYKGPLSGFPQLPV